MSINYLSFTVHRSHKKQSCPEILKSGIDRKVVKALGMLVQSSLRQPVQEIFACIATQGTELAKKGWFIFIGRAGKDRSLCRKAGTAYPGGQRVPYCAGTVHAAQGAHRHRIH